MECALEGKLCASPTLAGKWSRRKAPAQRVMRGARPTERSHRGEGLPYAARFAGQGPSPAGFGIPSNYLNESVPGQQAVGRRTEALLDFILGCTEKPFWPFWPMMNKPGDLQVTWQRGWLYPNQSLSARNSFGKNIHFQGLGSSLAPPRLPQHQHYLVYADGWHIMGHTALGGGDPGAPQYYWNWA